MKILWLGTRGCAMLTRQDPIEFRDLNIVLRRERLAQLKELSGRMER